MCNRKLEITIGDYVKHKSINATKADNDNIPFEAMKIAA